MIKAIDKKRFLSTSELLESGLTYYRINKLVNDGKLVRLNRSTYENVESKSEDSDFAIAAAYAPQGVVCLMSAARYYGLTTYLLDAVDVAIGRAMKISTLPDWPEIHVWYFSDQRYNSGIISGEDEGGSFRIYSKEKTVADILYYRNKIGIEETKEVLRNYLDSKDRDLVQLHRFAEKLGCKKILSTYLEVLL